MKKEEKVELEKKEKSDSEKKSNWWKCVAIILAIIIIILLLLKSCGNGGKHKIIIHNGDEIIEVDKNFKLSDLIVEGGIASFLVDSDGNIVDPNEKLDPSKEYSVHIIPDGAERVKVTYKNGEWKLTVKYQKGSGLLFPKSPKKENYVFLGWKDEKTNNYPAKMSPVNEDMTLVAQFGKSESEGGVCTLNCDTNKDGVCDLNCDKDGDGKPDTNVDTNGDGTCDLNCDINHDNICDSNCDKDGDGNPDANIDYDNDGICDLNCDVDNDGTCDFKCDTNGDGTCDVDCDIKWIYSGAGYWTVDCEGHYAWYAVQCTKTKGNCISFTWDGKEIEPKEEIKGEWSNFEFPEYVGTGKTYMFDAKFWGIDKTGQKYYHHIHLPFVFDGNCDAKLNSCADTNENGKCDEDLLLVTDDYDIEVGCKVGVAHRQTKKGVLVSSTINGEEVEPDEILDIPESKYKWPTWHLTKYNEIGEPIELIVKGFDYDENGKKYEYAYTSHISFTDKCTNPDENLEPKVTYTCPSDYELSGTKCTKQVTDTRDAQLVDYTCSAGFTYTASDGRCHKTEAMGCPAGYNDGPNGCEKQVFDDLQCGSPYHVCGDNCCEADGTITQREQPHCQQGYVKDNSGTRCYTWLYDAQRGCYGENSTAIPGSFECDTIINATPNYSCNAGYTLSGAQCIKTTTETIDAIKETN